ncbi:hypothetical protein AVEN_64267-1 [Araneus ventricosus]|uniref:Uncharacterized protein n=1 Tax=Araneus ventricosus TaxID=182803 RepID=A0A4Y2UWR5_ARAVE|nr:hypothetical protein AVEN_64267-1 [Araneus ventricosus]
MAHKFIGLHDSDFRDSVRSVLYDSDGEEFYEERRSRSSNQGLQQPNPPYLLEIPISKLMIQTQILIRWQLRMDATRMRLTMVFSSKLASAFSCTFFPSVLMPNPRIMDRLIEPTFGHLSNDAT